MAVFGIDASRANVEQRTGTEWYIFNVLQQFKQLIPNHHQVIVYTKEPLREDLLPLPNNWESRVLHWPPKLLWTQLRLSLHMLRTSQRPDVLFIPAHTIPIKHPKNTVYVAHDLGFERYPELYANTYIGGRLMNVLVRLVTLGRYGTSELDYHRWSMQFATHHAKKIISISDFTKTDLQELYQVPDKQIVVVHNGFSRVDHLPDLPVSQAPHQTGGQTSQQANGENSVVPTDPYLLFVGRLEHKKNIVRLVEAFAELKSTSHVPHKLCLVGFPGFGYEEIQVAIKQHNIQDDIIELGYVPQEQLTMLMQHAAAFVFPTNYEGFGIPVLEALSSGTMVACSDIPPLREVGGPACIYFDQTNSTAIAQALYHVLTLSPDEQQTYRQLGTTQVARFSWERCAEETWQVLSSLVE